eukprot:3949673-Alexandrium_andersonii.AAC.1
MWIAIHSLFPPLAFSQSFMEKLFAEVATKAAAEKWPRPLNDDELKSWLPAISKQFRSQARHIAQAKLKKNKWIYDLLGKDALEVDCAVPELNVESQGEAKDDLQDT